MFKKMSERGFTLVELMVVVAIIGILSAVAIPNFKKYQAKSKTSEAKMQLSSIYTYELTAQSDYDTFTSCLGQLGYSAAPRGYYVTGFSTNFRTADAIANGLAGCGATEYFAPGGIKTYGTTVASTDLPSNGGDQSAFVAGAAGNLDATSIDQWSINQDKNLIQVQVGY